jgi:hypothetical protein
VPGDLRPDDPRPGFAAEAVRATGAAWRRNAVRSSRMQARLERRDWVRVRTHLRQSLGFTNRAARSRAVAELERLGFVEVRRRKGYAPLVRLVPQEFGVAGG